MFLYALHENPKTIAIYQSQTRFRRHTVCWKIFLIPHSLFGAPHLGVFLIFMPKRTKDVRNKPSERYYSLFTMLRDFDRRQNEEEENEPFDQDHDKRVKKAVTLLRDFPNQDDNNDDDDNDHRHSKRTRRAGGLRLALHQGSLFIRRYKRLAACGLVLFVVLFVSWWHLAEVNATDSTSLRLLPKTNCNFRKYRSAYCPKATGGPNERKYQICVLDLIFSTIGTTNKKYVEIVQFPENSTIGGVPHYRQHQVRQRRAATTTTTNKNDTSTTSSNDDTFESYAQHLINEGFQAMSYHVQPSPFSHKDPRHDIYLVSQASLARKMNKAHIPHDLELLSINVHSIDVWLLYSVLRGGFRPRVVAMEFNANFASDMLVSVDRHYYEGTTQVQHHDQDTVVFGASAAAIDYVAQKFDYVTVEIMTSRWDMFLVPRDILQKTCSNFDFMDTFETLSFVPKLLGYPWHAHCDVTKAREHLVDVPLALAGKMDDAKALAHLNVEELNLRRQEARLPMYCPKFSLVP